MDKLELYAGIRVIERGGRVTKGNSDNEKEGKDIYGGRWSARLGVKGRWRRLRDRDRGKER